MEILSIGVTLHDLNQFNMKELTPEQAYELGCKQTLDALAASLEVLSRGTDNIALKLFITHLALLLPIFPHPSYKDSVIVAEVIGMLKNHNINPQKN